MKFRFWIPALGLGLVFIFSTGFSKRPSSPLLPYIPPMPWVSAINQIGFYALRAEIENQGMGNRVIAPFETLQSLLEKESGINPARTSTLEAVQKTLEAANEHAVDLKIKTEEGRRSLEFKGEWAEKFYFKKRKRLTFQTPQGPRSVAMIQSALYEAYLAEPEFQAVRLKYGDGKIALYLFLPKPQAKLGEFLKNLEESQLREWFPQFLERHGEVRMPRFKLTHQSDLKGVARHLGLLPGIFKDEWQTVFQTHESGAKKPAVTMPDPEIVGPEKFTMTVDRPFFFVVRDNETELLLLLGTVTNPAED